MKRIIMIGLFGLLTAVTFVIAEWNLSAVQVETRACTPTLCRFVITNNSLYPMRIAGIDGYYSGSFAGTNIITKRIGTTEHAMRTLTNANTYCHTPNQFENDWIFSGEMFAVTNVALDATATNNITFKFVYGN